MSLVYGIAEVSVVQCVFYRGILVILKRFSNLRDLWLLCNWLMCGSYILSFSFNLPTVTHIPTHTHTSVNTFVYLLSPQRHRSMY